MRFATPRNTDRNGEGKRGNPLLLVPPFPLSSLSLSLPLWQLAEAANAYACQCLYKYAFRLTRLEHERTKREREREHRSRFAYAVTLRKRKRERSRNAVECRAARSGEPFCSVFGTISSRFHAAWKETRSATRSAIGDWLFPHLSRRERERGTERGGKGIDSTRESRVPTVLTWSPH